MLQQSAGALVDNLMKAQPSYIRTIKPNQNRSSTEYDLKAILHQIKYLGLQENIRVRRAGFAYRNTFEKMVERFYLLSPNTSYAGEYTWQGDSKSGCEQILKDTGISKDQWQMGVTKAFIKNPETACFFLFFSYYVNPNSSCSFLLSRPCVIVIGITWPLASSGRGGITCDTSTNVLVAFNDFGRITKKALFMLKCGIMVIKYLLVAKSVGGSVLSAIVVSWVIISISMAKAPLVNNWLRSAVLEVRSFFFNLLT